MNMNHQKNQNEKDVWNFPCIFFIVVSMIGYESNFEKKDNGRNDRDGF